MAVREKGGSRADPILDRDDWLARANRRKLSLRDQRLGPAAAIGSILAIVASVMMVWLFWTHAGARGSGTGEARTMTDVMARTLNRLGQQRRGRLLFPGDERSVAATAIWPKPVGGMPRAVVHCRIPEDLQLAVRAARNCYFPSSVHGGGHDWGRALCQGISLSTRAV
jgi:hypothetical protein